MSRADIGESLPCGGSSRPVLLQSGDKLHLQPVPRLNEIKYAEVRRIGENWFRFSRVSPRRDPQFTDEGPAASFPSRLDRPRLNFRSLLRIR